MVNGKPGAQRNKWKPDSVLVWKEPTGGTLMQCLEAKLTDHKRTAIKALLKYNQVAINSSPTTQFNAPVAAGDMLAVNFTRPFVVFSHPRMQLVYEDDESLVAGPDEELREELEVLVPGLVGNAGVHAELGARLGLGAILAAKPLDHGGALLVGALEARSVVALQHGGEVKATDELLDGGELCRERRLCVRLLGECRDPAVEHELERPSLGARLGGEVAHELTVRG